MGDMSAQAAVRNHVRAKCNTTHYILECCPAQELVSARAVWHLVGQVPAGELPLELPPRSCVLMGSAQLAGLASVAVVTALCTL